MMQKALITGASSGIGHELAKIMAAKGHDLVLVSRDQKKLNQVRQEILQNYKVEVEIIAQDLSEAGAASNLHDKLKDKGIEILVNNAGVGLVGDFFDTDPKGTATMMRLNIEALTEMTHFFGGDFVKKGQGRILNIGSIAAFFPGPKQPVYYASKAFVRSFGRALAYNLRSSGVTATTLHPGVTKTNFFNAAQASNISKGASPYKVALHGYNAMMAGKAETTYGWWNRFLTNIFVRVTPYKLQPYIVDKASEV